MTLPLAQSYCYIPPLWLSRLGTNNDLVTQFDHPGVSHLPQSFRLGNRGSVTQPLSLQHSFVNYFSSVVMLFELKPDPFIL